MDVRDDARRHAGELPTDHCERGLLRALREHGVGPEARSSARRGTAARRRSGPSSARGRIGRTRWKRGSVPCPARAREHAHVELRLERVELLLERGRQRSEYRERPTMRRRFLTAAPLQLGLDRREDRLLRVARRPTPVPRQPQARSSASVKNREIARRAPADRPARRRPFSPSRTTSGTPPTASRSRDSRPRAPRRPCAGSSPTRTGAPTRRPRETA